MGHTESLFVLSFITPSPEVAAIVLAAGADRVVVDLESSGKVGRQGEATAIHGHTMEDAFLVSVFCPARTFVRVDSDPGLALDQTARVIKGGAAGVILPMYRTVAEVRAVRKAAGKSARVVALAETVDALASMEELSASKAADEVHFGLRDLSLELGLPFMFQAMVHPLLMEAASILRFAGPPFRIGGIAPPGKGLIDPLILAAAHGAMGSSGAFMSRDFGSGARETEGIPARATLADSIRRIRERYAMVAGECLRDPGAAAGYLACLREALEGLAAGS